MKKNSWTRDGVPSRLGEFEQGYFETIECCVWVCDWYFYDTASLKLSLENAMCDGYRVYISESIVGNTPVQTQMAGNRATMKVRPSQYCHICLDTNCEGDGVQSTYEEEFAANAANVRNFDAATQDMMKPILLHPPMHWMCKGCLSKHPPLNPDKHGGENKMICGVCRVDYDRIGVYKDGPPAPVSERSLCLKIAKQFQSGFFKVFRELHQTIQQDYTYRNANTWTIMINENFCETETFRQLGTEWKLAMPKTMLVTVPFRGVENRAEKTILEIMYWSVYQLGSANLDHGPYSVVPLHECRCEDRLFILRKAWLMKSSRMLSPFTMLVIQHYCKIFFQYVAHLRQHEREDESIKNLGVLHDKNVQSMLGVARVTAITGVYGWIEFIHSSQNRYNVASFLEFHPDGDLIPRLNEFSVAALLAFWHFLGDVTGDCQDPFHNPGASQQDKSRWGAARKD